MKKKSFVFYFLIFSVFVVFNISLLPFHSLVSLQFSFLFRKESLCFYFFCIRLCKRIVFYSCTTRVTSCHGTRQQEQRMIRWKKQRTLFFFYFSFCFQCWTTLATRINNSGVQSLCILTIFFFALIVTKFKWFSIYLF